MLNFNFVEMPSDAEMWRYRRAISWILRNPDFIRNRRHAGDALLENNWWLLGKNRYERVLYASLYLFALEGRGIKEKWFIKSLIDETFFIELPLPSEIELWDILSYLNVEEEYNLLSSSGQLSPPMFKMFTPLAEEWIVCLTSIFQLGYPKCKEVINEPFSRSIMPIKEIKERLARFGEWARAQGTFIPAADFLDTEKMSDALAKYIWDWRKSLYVAYGITPEPRGLIWRPNKCQRILLAKSNLDFGQVLKMNGTLNLRPKDSVYILLEAVAQWQEARNGP